MSETFFNQAEWLRYSRHIQLPSFGAKGQTQLKQSHVLIIGMGGLGAPIALYLAAAGVGEITIFDGDKVDVTNLQRQVIFNQADVGKPKADCAKQHMQALNPHIKINSVPDFFSQTHDSYVHSGISLVLDCTDNFASRYLINDICVEKKVPWVYASIHQFSGQCVLFTPGNACFRCLFPAPPESAPDCNTAGVIGVLPGLLGLFEANEAIKYLTGLNTELENRLLLFDALKVSIQKIELAIDKNCFCQTGKKTTSNATQQCDIEQQLNVSIEDFNRRRDDTKIKVLDVRSQEERQGFNIGGEHLPLDTIREIHKDHPDFDKNIDYYCYCQSGVRSEQAAQHLTDSGYRAYSLEGGLLAWLKHANQTL